ncbi:NHL repeat protein [Polystyrenella longa]|uniref:NHL repeat protein n=1 Tax=Polystyrenella longa TaxID=2528007 RepID=A0A518CK93_9PLAN|nr:twin-arginine translocation signal domain-containing protein [Polystyrenella longa]QDU79604.1 NHL repeat protein [Polystyrenella longa]
MSANDPRTSRRTFLKTAGTGIAAATALQPFFVRASDKSGKKTPIVGEGEYQYSCQHGWGELPDSIRWGATHGVAIDGEGMIYIKHQSAEEEVMDAIVVFDPDGKYVRSFGKEYHGGGHGIDVRSEDGEQFLYLSDVKNREVIKTTLSGEQIWKLSYPTEAHAYSRIDEFRPTNVAFHPDGGFYVGDGYGSHFIHQYDKDAVWVRTWGGKGTEPGKMQTPHGLWLDDRPGRTPSLVVADRANARLQYFTLEGEHIDFVDDVNFPADIDIQGEIMLVPDLHARVSLFDINNKPIVHLGNDPEWTKEVLDGFEVRRDASRWKSGKFVHPHDACFDADGNIYVSEWVSTGRINKLVRV